MLIKMYEKNPSQKMILRVVEELRNGGIVIFPTDTLYGLGCDIHNHKAVEKIARLKGLDFKTAKFSFICHDLSSISQYVMQIDTPTYKIMKKNLPGPFTFILNASNKVPKILKTKKRTVGIRVPDNNIIRSIVEELGNPILSTSIIDPDDDIMEYITDPELIYEKYSNNVDLVIDGGFGSIQGSCVVDCTGDEYMIIREGEKELML